MPGADLPSDPANSPPKVTYKHRQLAA